MKKDRNSFFSEYGFSGGMNPGMQNMMMPGGGMPNPGYNPAPGGMMPNMSPMPTDIDSRLAKLERAINRLETRVSKLEGETYQPPVTINDNDYNYNNSMYMV